MIDIVVPTWPNHPKRIEYLQRTLDSLGEHLTASKDTLRFLCSAESEHDPESTWHGDELTSLCGSRNIPLHWRQGQASLGGSMNTAARICTAPLYIIWQDDFLLLEPLDLSPVADFMRRHHEVAMHRISYFTDPVNGTKFKSEIEPGIRLVDIDGTWPYGDDPSMKHADFEQVYGQYLEGGRHGQSEGDMLFRLVAQKAIITGGMKSYCSHIGAIAAVPKSQEYRERAVSR